MKKSLTPFRRIYLINSPVTDEIDCGCITFPDGHIADSGLSLLTRYSYGILRTRVVIPATRGLCPRLELSLAATTSSEKSRIPTGIKTRE